jgi:hypothetical protein
LNKYSKSIICPDITRTTTTTDEIVPEVPNLTPPNRHPITIAEMEEYTKITKTCRMEEIQAMSDEKQVELNIIQRNLQILRTDMTAERKKDPVVGVVSTRR